MRAHDRAAGPAGTGRQPARAPAPDGSPRLGAVRQAAAAGEGTWAVSGAEIAAVLRVAGNSAAADLLGPERSTVDSAVAGPGRPLEPEVRADMERRLGADLAAVRLHTGGAAHASAAAVGALAYTTGSHVVFAAGGYDPASAAGRQVLAHELVHVLQQRNGPVAGTDTGTGLSVSDPHDRFERAADATARAALRDPPTRPTQ
ncbi:MAG TPA: DUF4157 domain-containing protein [Mycobacteriales bacterium]|nr:DUF4157 domain-containing protein [Mycobacteriales bacterium]